MITRLDHVVIAVRDLAAAVGAYETLLGRGPSWKSEAHGGGAAIVTFGLANVALEIMAPSGDGPVADRLRAVLDAEGEGLASIVFAVDDMERTHRRLQRVALEPEPIVDGESVDRLSGVTRHWRRTRASGRLTHGVRIFLMEQAVRPPAPLLAAEPAAVSGLDHVVIRTPYPERAAALYGTRLGLDLRLDRTNMDWGARLMFFRCGDLIVELAHDLKVGESSGPDQLWGLSWRVPDAGSTHDRLRSAGIDVSDLRPGRKPGTRVFTVRARTCGVATLVLEPGEVTESEEVRE